MIESLSLQINLEWKLSWVYKGLEAPRPTRFRTPPSDRRNAQYHDRHSQPDARSGGLVYRGQSSYRWSPIDEVTKARPVRVLGESTLIAGDMAPDAPGLSVVRAGAQVAETRFFDLFKATYHCARVWSMWGRRSHWRCRRTPGISSRLLCCPRMRLQ